MLGILKCRESFGVNWCINRVIVDYLKCVNHVRQANSGKRLENGISIGRIGGVRLIRGFPV